MRWTLTLVLAGAMTAVAQADVFDHYTNPDLTKAASAAGVKQVAELSGPELTKTGGLIPGTDAALLIVQTREDRWAKLLVQPGRQKLGEDQHPIILIERFVTFREGQERTVLASGKDIHLYPGFQFNLGLGQVVPARVGGDLLVPDSPDGSLALKANAKSKMYLVTKLPPATAPPKSEKLVVGEKFEPRYFNGRYKLHDDGRRFGTLTLDVDEASGEVSGSLSSEKDGRKYDVKGKLGTPRHTIQFTITFPQTTQQFTGHLFTGDARAIAGTSKLQDREAGFYAVRNED